MSRLCWKWPLAVVIVLLVVLPTVAAIREQVQTPGGPLIVQQMDEGLLGSDFVVMLGQRIVMRAKAGDKKTAFADFPVPILLKYIPKPVPPFDAVVVFQQYNWGNACDGGPIWFLGIHKDGTFSVSKPIDFCGGPAPVVSVTSRSVHVVLPASKDQKGSTIQPEEKWIFSEGRVRRVR